MRYSWGVFGVRKPGWWVGRSLLVAFALSFFASSPDARPGLRFDSLHRFSIEDGLPHTRIYDVLQDRRGFLWIATQNGLVRFDGYEFRVFEHLREAPGSLAENYIHDLYEDAEGHLWIATNGGGLDRYDSATGIFQHFRHDPEDPEQTLRDKIGQIQPGPGGSLWLITDQGVSRVDRAEQRLVPWFPSGSEEEGLPRLTSLLWDSNGVLWGLAEEGLFRFRDGRLEPFASDLHNGLREGSLFEDGSGRLWAFGPGVLMRFVAGEDRFMAVSLRPHGEYGEFELETSVPWKMHEDSRGHLWLGTVGQGVLQIDSEDRILSWYRHHASDDRSLSNDIVFSIYEDRAGVLWFGTNSGLNQLDPARNAFARYGYDPANVNSPRGEVLAIHEDASGNLWLGTFGEGLVRIDPQRQRAEHFRPDPANSSSLSHGFVWAIQATDSGDLWVGTEQGADLLDPEKGTFRHYRHDPGDPRSLSAGRVLAFLETENGLWISTDQGLNRFESEGGSFESFAHDSARPDSLANSPILTMTEGAEGRLWLGTDGAGLGAFDPETGRVTHYVHDPDDPQSLPHNIISALHWDSDFLWVATLGGGLGRLEPNSGAFLHFRKEQGLPTLHLSGMLPDDMGRFWLSHKGGLFHFDPRSEKRRLFDMGDGLLEGGFNTKASFSSPSGELFFGGARGFVAFDPMMVKASEAPPEVVITSLEINNRTIHPVWQDPDSPLEQTIEETRTLVLDASHRSVSFEFAALHHANPRRNRYRYQLEGFDEKWVGTDSEKRFAQYSNLPPGKYTFRVEGSNKDEVWSEAGLDLVVLPPLWQTWWAYLLYALTVVLVVLTFVLGQRRKVARERAINQQLRQVDRLKDEFLANTSHELRTPLHGMVGLAESLVDGAAGDLPDPARENLQMIVASGRRLGHLVNDLLDFSKLRQRSLHLRLQPVDLASAADVVLTVLGPLAARRKLELVHGISRDLPPARADENRLQQILYNLVGNALKFTDSGRVEVAAISRGEDLEVQVRDTGPGIAEEDQERIFESFERALDADSGPGGTGLGLAITRKLVELHGGQIEVESAPGAGSTFRFTIPKAEGLPAPTEALVVEDEDPPAVPNPITLPEPDRSEGGGVSDSSVEHPSWRILVVDDEPVNRRVLRNHLGMRRYGVLEAEDGEQALDQVAGVGPFDLVLLDVMMPGLSGFEVCRRLRQTYSRQELPVIFLTARGREEDLEEGLAVGANDYLLKPVSKSELLARVEMHLELLEAHRQLDRLFLEKSDQVKILQGLLPMCSSCKKIRDDEGYWNEVETFLDYYSEAEVSHGLCPDCAIQLYPNVLQP